MRWLLTAWLLAAGGPLSACKDSAKDEGFRIIHVNDLATLLADPQHKVYVFDANHDEFRQKEGVIAEATLLSSAHDYDVKKVLPPDKGAPLVFYCSNRL
jgi:hypothetical protein